MIEFFIQNYEKIFVGLTVAVLSYMFLRLVPTFTIIISFIVNLIKMIINTLINLIKLPFVLILGLFSSKPSKKKYYYKRSYSKRYRY